jgi:hypothetical protein
MTHKFYPNCDTGVVKRRIFTKLVVILSLFLTTTGSLAQPDSAIRSSSPTDHRIVVANAFDIAAAHFRKNKAALFYRLSDTLRNTLQQQLGVASGKEVLLTGHPLDAADPSDSSLLQLERAQDADWALVVQSMDVGFEQGEVEVSHDEGGTHKQAKYNIYSQVSYRLYWHDSLLGESKVRVFHYFSTRSVMSGLFAVGPNIVDNEKDAIDILKENAHEYCFNYFLLKGKKEPRLEKAGFHF